MTKKVVLDASAVLAFLQEENGSEKVDSVLSKGRAIISAVNYAEVVGKLLEAGLPESSVKIVMENLELQVEPLDDQQAWKAGMLRISTREFGLSLGDRACLALAHIKNLSIITADKQWDKLKIDIKIIQLH
ncbi:type II toxin-antitoxin system VapC family toxin [Methylobacter sp. YRD-M1]|uniref:type II toxin-antitoxin system VapC family toxin n=1 Tax=Methylobacter sp. YRD-M1 TaxID=2911520 RepID=UPI00227BFC7F|nr:type II toxin-antitoxin system VapC family toxin [Methylobacter sp. YRD-M1]WAK03047.1 type II toxin-antitoxin system VapC family toxin [Methylobacter sp. YRD-M1]